MFDHYTTVLFALAVVLVAGYVRGYSGFGASMIIIIGLSQVYPVAKVVPTILLLEVIASAYLLPKVYRKVDWKSLRLLLLGVAAGTPFGVYLLSNVSDRAMRIGISVLIICIIPLMWKRFTLQRMPGRPATLATGVFSGLANGSAAIGGPPVVLFYFSSSQGAHISRASLIAYFLVTDLMASAVCAWNGLVTRQTLFLTGILVIPLIIGLTAGARTFFKTDPERFRNRVLGILLVMAIATFFRSVVY